MLWWGKYVDFGTFQDAVSRSAQKKEIVLAFEVSFEKKNSSGYHWYEDGWDGGGSVELGGTNLRVELVIAEKDGQTYISKATVSSGENSCCLEAASDGQVKKISSGDIDWIPSASGDIEARVLPGELVPIPFFFRTHKSKDGAIIRRQANPLLTRTLDAISAFGHGNTSNSRRVQIASSIPVFGTNEDIINAIYLHGTPSWKREVEGLSKSDPRLNELRSWISIERLPRVLRSIAEEINKLARGVKYMEPLRATAQRYYRLQELAVDEVDSKGENLAVYIYSMSKEEKKGFDLWLRQHLGFRAHAHREGGHISLKVQFDDQESPTNLADTGFGLSQVLPIATQLWSSLSTRIQRGQMGDTTCVVVEQPELHLHPAFQEQIADLFVAAINHPKKNSFPIIAETHSSSLINRLGELIAENKIKKDDVQIVMFEQEAPTQPVHIRVAEFDEDGVLQNWPYGFFSAGGSV